MLTNVTTMSEVKHDVFGLNGDGALGLDGFDGCFYQAFWDVIGEDIHWFVLQSFKDGQLLPNVNSNLVVLIPKVQGEDFIDLSSPIALAYFNFQIITKNLVDHLTIIAPKIISSQQLGFIRDRHIEDGIWLAS